MLFLHPPTPSGTNNPAFVSASTAARFYRLLKPGS
jgi:hypothetical protein